MQRRQFIKTALQSAVATALPASIFAATSASLAATQLDKDIALIAGAGANVVAIRSSNGVALIDGGSRAHSDALLKFVTHEFSSRPIHTLFNTHWHPEQTGSNERLGKAGVKIIAHENTRLWLRTDAPLPEQETTYGPLPPKAWPSETFYTTGKMTLDNKRVEYGYLLQAHTDGDMYVFFPEANVLVAGGVLSNNQWPIIDWRTGGWISGMVNGLKTLVALTDAKTQIVPADGPVLNRAELQAQLDMYTAILGRVQKNLRQGLGPQEAVDLKPAKEFKPEWGSADAFVAMAFKSLWGHATPDA